MSEEERERLLTKEDVGFDIEVVLKEVGKVAKDETMWQIREIDFITHFLPVFSGQEENETKLGHWTRLAGGPGYWVTVVDQMNKPLFKVPPLQSVAMYNPGSVALSGISAASIVARYRAISTSARRSIAPEYLNAHMSEFLRRAQDDIDFKEVIEAWNEIFKRYNIELPEAAEEVERENSAPEVIGYDPI